MKITITFALVCSTICAWSQPARSAKDYAQMISADSLKQHLYIIAEKEMQGRETGTAGQRMAAAYIESQFRKAGLLPGFDGDYTQTFKIIQDSLSFSSLAINGKNFKTDANFIVSSFTSNVDLESKEILFVGYGETDSTHDDYKNLDAAGKAVLIMPGKLTLKVYGQKSKNRVFDFYAALANAKKHGVTAVLVEGKNFPRQENKLKNSKRLREDGSEMPAVFVISEKVAKTILGKEYSTIKKELIAGKYVSSSISMPVKLRVNKVELESESSNVMGYIQGSEKKDEAIVISAHYDHLGMKDSTVYFGADDDGSGTVAVMELARIFAKAALDGYVPRRSILFITVSGEEEGLWGSQYYAGHPAVPLEKTSADLNIDMIGRIGSFHKSSDSSNYIYVVGDNRISSELRNISEAVNDSTTKLSLDYSYNSPNDREQIYYRSDHYNFARNGVPIIFYFSGLHKDYHRPSDTPDKINYALLRKRAQLVFNTAWEIANRKDMLVRDLPLP